MNMETVKELMRQAGWGFLATSDGEKVGVRPMGGWAWFGSQLWCATAADSDKVAQLRKVPYAEYCFCDAEGRHTRIAGKCTISTDNAEKLKLFQAVPQLKNYISDPASPEYEVIKLTPQRVRIMAGTDLQYEEIKIN